MEANSDITTSPEESVSEKKLPESPAKTPNAKSETARPSSPPPNCAICLGQIRSGRNRSFTDTCLHQFCFKCLVTWSKVKPECPLCKQTFKSIIYNVKSNQHYDEYPVEPINPPEPDFIDLDYFEGHRFRYRTTLTLHRHESSALEHLLMDLHVVTQPPTNIQPSYVPMRRRSRRGANFRQSVYRHNLWANPLPDVTGRHRECSPQFFRDNPAQVHRLVPWLQRELSFLLPNNQRIIQSILEIIPFLPILSTEFRRELYPFLGSDTDHFLHEFHSFASSSYDMIGYDRNVQYVPEASRPVVTFVNEVLSGDSDSNNSDSNDSDIVFISPSTSSTVNLVSNEPSTSNGLNSLSNSVIAIETMSHSDTEDSSDEVVMVGYIKPPHERTPEVVDLASDSDTMVIEDEITSPIEVTEHLPTNSVSSSVNQPSLETPSTSGLVKIKLKRNYNGVFQSVLPDSTSDDSTNNGDNDLLHRRSKRIKRNMQKNRVLSRDSASTEDTDRDTDDDDVDFNQSEILQKSDNSEDDSNYSEETKRPIKSKQVLASEILKKFKRKSTSRVETSVTSEDTSETSSTSYYTPPISIDSPSTSNHSPSTSTDNSFNKKSQQKKSKRILYSTSESSSENSDSEHKKLKIKGRSKSKERLINKIFENRQVNDSTNKSIDSSKAKVKNKLFNKSFNKQNYDVNAPSTSSQFNNPFFYSDSSEEEGNKSPPPPNSLLDIISKSILKNKKNSIISLNNTGQTSTSNSPVSDNIKQLIDEINVSVFKNQSTPLNLSCRDRSSD